MSFDVTALPDATFGGLVTAPTSGSTRSAVMRKSG